MEDYILASAASKVGGYVFEVDMSDSLCTYDFDFYARLDARRSDLGVLQDYPLSLTWTDPDGEKYTRTVYLDVTKMSNQTYFSRQLFIPYMENVVPKKRGIWQLRVSVPDVMKDLGVRGMGLVARRNDQKL